MEVLHKVNMTMFHLTEASPLYIHQSTLGVINLGNTLEENDVWEWVLNGEVT